MILNLHLAPLATVILNRRPIFTGFQTPFIQLRLSPLQFSWERAGIISFSPAPLNTSTTDNFKATSTEEEEDEEAVKTPEPSATPVRIVLVGENSVSPLKSSPWLDVMLHTAKRLKWVDEAYDMLVFSDGLLKSTDKTMENLHQGLRNADILLIVAVTNQESVEWVQANSVNVPSILCFESSPMLRYKLGGSIVETKSNGYIFSKLTAISQSKRKTESTKIVQTVSEAWDRHNSDDIRFCLLVVINAYIRPVPILKNLRAKGFSTLNCMVKNCGPQILNCLLDPNCRKALQCLNKCSPVDQFRGDNLSHETAEDLFVAWLGKLDWSWRVIAGQNPAYDQFPCQYQLFYRGKARGSFWFEPIFQVRTLEGDLVWRRRKYRVRRGKVPATFHFSVLDNGVVSNEFWTIVDVSDDFSWGLFHYHGAARVAGQSYTGAVLVSPDGMYPDETQRQRLFSALDRCDIKEWELFNVDNLSCPNPPLGLPEGSRLHSKIEPEDMKA